jgi:F-type H+-transporting ATPase subunit gamma
MPGRRVVWVVGERVRARLADAGFAIERCYPEPTSVEAIAPLIDRLQFDTETHPSQLASPHIHIFFNQPRPGALYQPVGQRLLPLDEAWRAQWMRQGWPTSTRPEVVGNGTTALQSLIREHLFIALYRACAESLASENASRLAAMERADKNIEEILGRLRGSYRSERQSAIDEELFDVVAGAGSTEGKS